MPAISIVSRKHRLLTTPQNDAIKNKTEFNEVQSHSPLRNISPDGNATTKLYTFKVTMKKTQLISAFALLLSLGLFPSISNADERGVLIFHDEFERSESQETTDEIGNGWGSNSKSRAGGNKQVDLKDGTMRIYIHEAADHAVSVTQSAEFQNGSVEMRFMLEDEKDTLGLNFADLQFKEVWAGHLFKVTVGVKQVEIADLKTGVMNLETRNARQDNSLTAAQQADLKTKSARFPHKLETGKWYTVDATVSGDTMTVSIDGKEVGSFASEGIAHPTKRMLRLSIPKNVVVDDVKIFAKR
jgi:hypothetical protein